MANTIPFDGCIPSEIIDLVFANTGLPCAPAVAKNWRQLLASAPDNPISNQIVTNYLPSTLPAPTLGGHTATGRPRP